MLPNRLQNEFNLIMKHFKLLAKGLNVGLNQEGTMVPNGLD